MILFDLSIPRIDENNTLHLFDQLCNIEHLTLKGKFYYFNLESLVNLKTLIIIGHMYDSFNIELLRNISNQLHFISIINDKTVGKIDYDFIIKLFSGYNFSTLGCLDLRNCNMRRLEKKFMDQFPNLKLTRVSNCNLEMIEDDALSQKIVYLDLRQNLFKTLCKRDFSKLINLKYFNMSKNNLESFENGIFSNMKNLESIDLSDNHLVIENLKAFGCADTIDIKIDNNHLFLNQ